MKDFRVTIRVTNANIQRSIEGMGYMSIPKWCEAFKYPYGTLNSFINLRLSPISKKGGPTPSAKKLCDLLGESFDEIFSEHQLDPISKNRASVDVSFEQIERMITSDGAELLDAVFDRQKKVAVLSAVDQLNPKRAEVIRLRFGLSGEDEATLVQTSEKIGVTRERIRQIEAIALRNLRNPKFSLYSLHESQ